MVDQSNYLYVIGGWGSTDVLNDVWRSGDGGASWEQRAVSAAWSTRSAACSVVDPGNYIYVMGGRGGTTPFTLLNDVWWSGDGGVTWTQMIASAQWGVRFSSSCLADSLGRLYLMGGHGNTNDAGPYYNDVWRSSDGGITWTCITSSAPWAGRSQAASVIDSQGVIYIMAGYSSGTLYSDVWKSSDFGSTWQQVGVSGSQWGARTMINAAMDPSGAIYVVGGYNGYSVGNYNDVWISGNGGTSWQVVTSSASWPPRNSFTALFDNVGRLFVLGGGTNSGIANDIWVASCSFLAPTQSPTEQPTTTTAQWPKFRYNDYGTGLSPYNLSFAGTPTARVKYQTGGEVWSSPAIAQDGSIVVGSYDYYIYCLTSAGSLRWRYQTGSTGNSVYSSPAITQDGSIVVGSKDGYIYVIGSSQPTASPTPALTASARPSAAHTLPTALPTAARTLPTAALIYPQQLSTTSAWPKFRYNDFGAGLSPYSLMSFSGGASAWAKFQTGGVVYSSPAIAQDGSIVVGSKDNYVYCLTSAGSLRWRYMTDAGVLSSPAITQDGSIVVGSWDFYIYCLTSAGSLRWRYQTGNDVQSSPAIAQDGSIVVGSHDGYIYCLTSVGSLRWRYQTGGSVFSSPAIAQDGSIVVGSNDKYIYYLTSAGSLRWSYQTGAGVYSSPAIAQDGSIVVGSYDSYIYCLTSAGSLRWSYLTGSQV